MDFLNRMIKVIDYLESHLTDRLDLQDLSNIICCNPYQFGRIFSYVTGIPLAEYVRKRRLSLAAAELAHGTSKVLDTAYKYGYSSPEAFARAFKEMHGISPREAAVFGAECGRVLAQMAYFPEFLVPGVCLYPAGREPLFRGAECGEPDDRMDAHGDVARSCLEFYRVGCLLRRDHRDGEICVRGIS